MARGGLLPHRGPKPGPQVGPQVGPGRDTRRPENVGLKPDPQLGAQSRL